MGWRKVGVGESVPKLRRYDRPISVSAVPAGDIWQSCRFLGAMLRA